MIMIDEDGVAARATCGERACVVMPYLFTAGLLVDYSSDGVGFEYSARYCYPSFPAALIALRTWSGAGDPPGPWVKEKVSGRLGPGAAS